MTDTDDGRLSIIPTSQLVLGRYVPPAPAFLLDN